MIHDLSVLDPLLRQYDPEKVLVGPLLNLWTNSSFRVFNIAGNGGKVHETIGLGFVKVETDAQRRRADIVAVLQSHFGEVQIFDSQLEMARVAHTLWANDETSRFLATATAESKLQMTKKVDQDQSMDDASKSSVLPSDPDKELIDEAARGSVATDVASTHAPLSADQAQPLPVCDPTQAHKPRNLPEAYASLPLNGNSFTFAVVGLKSSADGIATTETAAEADANTETAAETVAKTIAEIDANTLNTRSAKPKRRSPGPRRGSAAAPAAAVGNTETIGETDANTERATETDANAQPAFEHSDQIPFDKRLHSERVSGGVLAAETHSLASGTLQSVGTTLGSASEAIVSAASVSMRDRQNRLTSLLHHLAIDPGAPDQEWPMAGSLPAPPLEGPTPSPPPRPLVERARSWKSIIFRFCAIGGLAALVVWMMVLSRAREIGHEAVPVPVRSLLSSTDPDNDSSQASAAIARSATPDQIAKAELTARPVEPVPVLQPSLLLSPSHATPVQAGTASVAEPPSPPPQSLSAEAGATPVAEPPSPPAQAMSVQLGAASGVGPSSLPPQMQGAPAGIASVSGPQAQSSQMTGTQTRAAPISRPISGSAHGNDTIMRLDTNELAMLLSRARDLLKSGDLASARLLLRRATQAGDANAALMLGATFDPFFSIGAIGIAPDIAQARQWYEKAAELGSEVATERLARLAKTGSN